MISPAPKSFTVDGVPGAITPTWHVEPCPRRIRAVVGGSVVVDTTRARYVWEWPGYPQLYVPLADVTAVLGDPRPTTSDGRGDWSTRTFGTSEVAVVDTSPIGLADHLRLAFDAVEEVYEEDEQVFVHPRSPYTRVDALPSRRHVVVELDGVVLADSTRPVLLFETGLPTRYYLPRLDVRFEHLQLTGTVTQCPYKGRTSATWAVRTPSGLHPDLAWSYDFPTRQALPVVGLVAFLDEKVDVTVDGVRQERPRTRYA